MGLGRYHVRGLSGRGEKEEMGAHSAVASIERHLLWGSDVGWQAQEAAQRQQRMATFETLPPVGDAGCFVRALKCAMQPLP